MTDAWMVGLIEAYNLQKYEDERKENGRKQGPLGTITVAKKGSKSSSEAAGRASKAVGGVLNVSGGSLSVESASWRAGTALQELGDRA